MSWKAHCFLNPCENIDDDDEKETFGFNSTRLAPVLDEMKEFKGFKGFDYRRKSSCLLQVFPSGHQVPKHNVNMCFNTAVILPPKSRDGGQQESS